MYTNQDQCGSCDDLPRCSLKVNDIREGAAAVEVKQAFDFTLDKLGQDYHAGQLWSDYLTFLQGPKPGAPAFQALFSVASAPGQEEAHRVAVIRYVVAYCMGSCIDKDLVLCCGAAEI